MMDRFLYDSITSLRDALTTGVNFVRPAAVYGPTALTDGSIRVI